MKLRLIKKITEVGEVTSFIFESQDLIAWQAGQYINITMPGVPPAAADRLFTIASAQHEGEVRITTYIGKSEFKTQMADLKLGDEVEADQLGGDFTYIEDERTKLFIAGGIGATTYRSIALERLHRKQPLNALLLYAGASERRPFVPEFEQVAQQDPTFTVKNYVTTRLTLEKLLTDVPDVAEYLIYLSGSQKFVETLGDGLIAQGLKRSQIKYDYFDGYDDLEY